MSSPSSKRYVFIDALRGLAAFAVVLFHVKAGRHIDQLSGLAPTFVGKLLDHGYLGVQVFFVLSGFVIAHSMVKDDVTLGYVGRFVLRRAVRLDPPYWASMALAIGMGALSARVVAGKTYEAPGLGRILAHVFYLPDLLGLRFINDIYWTLAIEIQFYLVFCGLMMAVTRIRRFVPERRALLLVLTPVTAFANLWPLGILPFEVRGLFLPHWHLFVLGVWVWWGVHAGTDRVATCGALTELAILASAAIARSNSELLVGVSTGALIYVGGVRNRLHTWCSARLFQLSGAVSYSLYLVHNPVTGAVFRAGYSATGRSVLLEGLWFSLAVATSVLVAYGLYRLVERPSVALSHRVRLRTSEVR